MNTVPMGDLVWPYRPDLLIRIDFLEWWREAQPELWPDAPARVSADAVRARESFFAEARRHPYFVQFTRKKRYAKRHLSLEESSEVYAEGVAAFLNLLSSIEVRGYDPSTPIGLRTSLFQRSSGFGVQHRRRWFIGDGCHRYACVSWLERGRALPRSYFAVERKLAHRPLDWRGMLCRLGVLDAADQAGFDALFAGSPDAPWESVLAWMRSVRRRFGTLDLEKLFAIRPGH